MAIHHRSCAILLRILEPAAGKCQICTEAFLCICGTYSHQQKKRDGKKTLHLGKDSEIFRLKSVKLFHKKWFLIVINFLIYFSILFIFNKLQSHSCGLSTTFTL